MTGEEHDEALAALRGAALGRGYLEGLDFYVQGFRTTFSSELVVAVRDDHGYRIAYRDMGVERDLVRDADIAAARDEFFSALARLGRGVEAEPAPEVLPPLSDAEIVAQFLKENPRATAWPDESTHASSEEAP